MAGNGNSEFVRRACFGDGTRRFRRSDAPSDFGVANRRADGDFAQHLPYALLEGRAANVEREIEANRRRFNEADNLRDKGLIVAIGANETRFRKTILQIANERVRIIPEEDRRNALLA